LHKFSINEIDSICEWIHAAAGLFNLFHKLLRKNVQKLVPVKAFYHIDWNTVKQQLDTTKLKEFDLSRLVHEQKN